MAEIIYPIGIRDGSNDSLRTKVNDFFYSLLENDMILLDSYIVIFLERRAELIYVIESCFKLGITYIPVDTTFPDERVRFILDDSKANIIITSNKFKERFTDHTVLVIEEHGFKNQEPTSMPNYPKTISNCPGTISNDKLAYIIYTSGTSGQPKGVKVSRRAVWNFIEGEAEFIKFGEQRSMLCSASVSFDIFFAESIMPLIYGTKIILLNEREQNNVALFTKAIIEHNVDMIQITPSRIWILYEYDKELACLKNMDSILIGGENISQQLLDIVKKSTNSRIYNAYGPTETAICVSIADLRDSSIISLGRSFKNVAIRLYDDDLEPVPAGGQGEICIEGLSVGEGYLNNVELTEEKFVRDFGKTSGTLYRTGDLGEYLFDGSIKYLGRKDNQIKLNGYRIELEEIENVAKNVCSVSEAIAKISGNSIVLYYVTSDENNDPLLEASLKKALRRKLPSFMVPARYFRVKQFYYTKNGKIDRHKIS